MSDQDQRRRQAWFDGFRRIIAKTTLPPALADEFAADLIDDPTAARAAQILRSTLLFRHQWDWPELDEWAARFSKSRRWPKIWGGYADAYRSAAPDEKTIQRITLLHHSLIMAGTSAQRLSDFISLQSTSMFRYSLTLHFIGDNTGALEKRIGQPFQKAILAGDYSNLPPFFPGDRTSLSSIRQP